jgi:hypothetical protein
LETVSLPAATGIGAYAFHSTGSAALTITLPKAAPAVGYTEWSETYTKTVTIKTPADRTGYDNAWEADFKKTFGEDATITLVFEIE